MPFDHIIVSIDTEIARLKQVRALLSSTPSKDGVTRGRKRRKMSAAARKRIAEAQRERWAKQRAAK